MIEQLKNCPNCSGILNESGTCTFCGSKVYDFLAVDFTGEPHMQTAKTYIRIRCRVNGEERLLLAPIIIDNVSLSSVPFYSGYTDFMTDRVTDKLKRIETSLDIHCQVIDECYQWKETK